MTNISCIINRTTDFRLEEEFVPDDVRLPTVWLVTGCQPWIRPGMDCGGFSEIGMGGSNSIVGVAGWINPNATLQDYIGTFTIASDANYCSQQQAMQSLHGPD